jgi:hypothetical protein
MSKKISELLDASEPLFSIALRQLEQLSGNPSADVRLTAEIVGKVYAQMRALGLDPHDSTGKELYQALMNLTALHDGFLAKKIGSDDPDDVKKLLPLIKNTAEKVPIPRTAWVMKHSTAKRLLKEFPPHRLMKHLGYRSVDSMLKREPMPIIYGALRFSESPQWLNNYIRRYKKLVPSDFETRKIEIIHLDSKRWGKFTEKFVRNNRHNVTHMKENGVIVILPLPVERMKGVTITVLPLVLHYLNEIRMYSAYFKLQQVQPKFGGLLAETLVTDPPSHAVLAGQNVHWRVIHRHFAASPGHHPEIFEPHVQPEDLQWRRTEEVLYRLEPALHFWHGMDYVGLPIGNRPISFSLMDMAVSYVNGLPYGHHSIYHFRESLWNELFMRYMGHEALEREVLKQLNLNTAEPETIALSLKGAV